MKLDGVTLQKITRNYVVTVQGQEYPITAANTSKARWDGCKEHRLSIESDIPVTILYAQAGCRVADPKTPGPKSWLDKWQERNL